MAMHNPKGRANYEPNNWGKDGGPRENPHKGFSSYALPIDGEKRRVRSETFADHYSQARQFYISQTKVEQKHLCEALVFELSKVEKEAIRALMVGHLLNIDEDLAKKTAEKLGLEQMPKPAEAAKPTLTSLKASDKLSILKNSPQTFKGRKIGVLMTDGADGSLYGSLMTAAKEEGATLEVIAPRIGGVKDTTGQLIQAQQKVEGGPSVFYDAVVLLLSEDGGKMLAKEPTARDFVSDAFVHCKFIGYTQETLPLLAAAGVDKMLDDGCLLLEGQQVGKKFITMCRELRYWPREMKNEEV